MSLASLLSVSTVCLWLGSSAATPFSPILNTAPADVRLMDLPGNLQQGNFAAKLDANPLDATFATYCHVPVSKSNAIKHADAYTGRLASWLKRPEPIWKHTHGSASRQHWLAPAPCPSQLPSCTAAGLCRSRQQRRPPGHPAGRLPAVPFPPPALRLVTLSAHLMALLPMSWQKDSARNQHSRQRQGTVLTE